MDKEARIQKVGELVARFAHEHALHTGSQSSYNGAQLRVDLLNPFLEALGWDVYNECHAPEHVREVVHEDTLDVDEGEDIVAKRPDYALRVGAEAYGIGMWRRER